MYGQDYKPRVREMRAHVGIYMSEGISTSVYMSAFYIYWSCDKKIFNWAPPLCVTLKQDSLSHVYPNYTLLCMCSQSIPFAA